jgi:hypothetical protein
MSRISSEFIKKFKYALEKINNKQQQQQYLNIIKQILYYDCCYKID